MAEGNKGEADELLLSARSQQELPSPTELKQEAANSKTGQLLSVAASISYGFVALVMGFINKACLQRWPYSNTLLTLQMAATILIIFAGTLMGAPVRPFSLQSAWNLLPVVFFYNANVAFALAGLQALNIPIFNSLKRLTPVMVLAAKYLIEDKPPPREILLSVSTVVSGCIIAGLGDLTFNLFGYSMALISCVLQTSYLLLVERSGSEKGFNSGEILLYNAVLSLPILLVIIHVTGEVFVSVPAVLLEAQLSAGFAFLLLFSLGMGVLLNYTLFLCTLCNSALTTTIVGALKGVVSSCLGFFLLGGVQPTFLVILGITMNTCGGVWYTFAKYKQRNKRQRENNPHSDALAFAPLKGAASTPAFGV